jgi:5-hmdU DNA kinase, helical domain
MTAIKRSDQSIDRTITLAGGRTLVATPVFETYWRFAKMRQDIFMQRVAGTPPPYTGDPVLAVHRFTNAYRASDRVSQFLIRHVLYEGDQHPAEVFFRAVLFKIFNRIDTWLVLQERMGRIEWKSFGFERYAKALDHIIAAGNPLYSGAYIMPSPDFGNARKHRNHLRLIERMMRTEAPARVAEAESLKDVFNVLLSYPSLGDFLAFQFAIDLNYSSLVNFPESDFVVAGPGARDGIRKCFVDTAGLSDEDVIYATTELAEPEFARLGIEFHNLWGRQLQPIDCQNIFCEVDKYARVMHPEYQGNSGRLRIKQKYTRNPDPLPQWYPPKWNLRVPNYAVALSGDSEVHPEQLRLV